MSDNLTTLISKTQALLGDDGTLFSADLCTAAARMALKTYNEYIPLNKSALINAVTDQYVYELTATDPRAVLILDILLQDPDDLHTSLGFDQYNLDEKLYFRLRSTQETGETLICHYTAPHTINGLDNETETTIPAWLIPVLLTGIAAEALQIRARARTEKINLQKDVRAEYSASARELKAEYRESLRKLAANKRGPVGEPDTRAWTV